MINFPPSPVIGQEFTEGDTTWRWDGVKWTFVLRDPNASLVASDNLVINGNFAINQRGRVSASALASNAYGHDRWKAGQSACNYTFITTLPDTEVTIPAGAGSLLQVVEAGMIEAGVHTLSWAGTAQGRVYQGAAPGGGYAASPVVTPALPAGVNTIVEFTGAAGTLTRVKLERGNAPTPFNRLSLARTLFDCQRYYQRIVGYVTSLKNFNTAAGGGQPSNNNYETIVFPQMRIAPPTVDLPAAEGNWLGGTPAKPTLTAWRVGTSFVSIQFVVDQQQGNNQYVFNINLSAEL